MERLLLESSIRVTLTALATAAILPLMRARSAAVRHAVWTGVVLLMLLLPVWTGWGPKAELRILRSPATVLREIAPMALQSEMAAVPMTNAATRPSVALINGQRRFGWSLQAFVLAIYAMGASWLLIRLAIGTVGARRLRREAVEADGGLLTSDACAAPVTIGWFLPAIILPQGWRDWTRPQLKAVLAHERAHLRRRDPLVQWLALLNRAVFWFHPLAWWLERRLAELAEEACDDAVLRDGHDPVEYAEYLLEMERSVKQAGARVPALGMAMPGAGLPGRISLIFDGPRWPRMSRMRMACIGAACAMTAAVFGAGTLEPAAQLQRPPMQPPQVYAPNLDAIPAAAVSEGKPPRVLLAQSAAASQAQNGPTPPAPSPAGRPPFEAPSGAVKRGDKRLLVLYFDMPSMLPRDQLRALVAAEKFIRSQMSPSDLIAIMKYNGATVTVLSDFADDRDKLQGVIENVIVGGGQESGIAVSSDNGAPLGQGDREFKIFTMDRRLAALQTVVKMLGTLNENKVMVVFASGLDVNGVDNQAEMHATENAAIRANVSLWPVDARSLTEQEVPLHQLVPRLEQTK
jgi:beta-lactamase regulating signal transducer with metallopeptidase domain